MEVSNRQRLKSLREENRRLRKLLSTSMFDIATRREAMTKNF
jgi:putative transposase